MYQSPIQSAPTRPGEYSQQDAVDDLLRRRAQAMFNSVAKDMLRRILQDRNILSEQELEEFIKDFDLEELLREED